MLASDLSLAAVTDAAATATTAVLAIDGASVERDGQAIVRDLTLRVAPGQHTAILGANGAGKSTLVQLVTRQIYPLARADGRGRVRVFGRERWAVAELRQLIGIVSPSLQHEFVGDAELPVFDAVVSAFFAARGLGLDQHADAATRERACAALQQVGAAHLATRRMASLSTGEARRVLIARALVHRPRALLLDEPCAGLDLAARQRFLETLRTLAVQGTTLILVTHHVEEILPEMRQVVLMAAGRILAQGTPAATLTAARLGSTFGVPIDVMRYGAWYAARVSA